MIGYRSMGLLHNCSMALGAGLDGLAAAVHLFVVDVLITKGPSSVVTRYGLLVPTQVNIFENGCLKKRAQGVKEEKTEEMQFFKKMIK